VKVTGDEHPYLLWAPLGRLPAGEYELELFDNVAKKVTESRTCEVVGEWVWAAWKPGFVSWYE
jgi:hypothetical protein